jgi:MYXO-CTERM domain-containing protein
MSDQPSSRRISLDAWAVALALLAALLVRLGVLKAVPW